VPFWEQPRELWDTMQRVGLRSTWIVNMLAAPMMVAQKSGFIVNLSSAGGQYYMFNAHYNVQKAALDKMAEDMAQDLRPHNVAAISLWPGFTKTERIDRAFKRGTKLTWSWEDCHSQQFIGRGIAAMAADPRLMDLSGGIFTSADLGVHYG